MSSNSHITHGIISFLNQISASPGFNASMINECLDEYFDDYSSFSSSAPNFTTTMETSSSFAVIETPPSDIEGRCSASNLPRSLDACLTACHPSACCYPGFNGETCFDNIGCSLYRPYCDVIYDPWINGTSGVLKEVTDETIGKCTETKAATFPQRSPASYNRSTVISSSISSTVKRLRGHVPQVKVTSSVSHSMTKTFSGSTKDACESLCIAAKCCSAANITDPGSSGPVLFLTGGFTNEWSGEYVMTNCRMTNTKNFQLCAKYREFCPMDEVNTEADAVRCQA